jgi:two-component system NtrC family response regulator
LFLDEIADLPLSVQSKLLRVLETGKFRRIGSSREETVDVRFMCASNQNLKQLVFEGRFRKDLYYRIADIVIEIPPLRDRMDDIKMLVDYFLDKNISITDEAVRKLSEYLWPGNVREFVKCIKRATVLGDGKVVREENIIF